MSQSDGQGLGLMDLIAALRAEVEAAQDKFSSGKKPMFYIDAVEVEVHFVVESAASAGGGLHIYFLTVEGKHEYKAQNIHKLKVSLKPQGDPISFGRPSDPRVRTQD